MRRGLLLLLPVIAIGGCDSLAQVPKVGDTWQIEAVDRSGAFGSITIRRGDVIPLPPGPEVQVRAPGATSGILVRVTYEPNRPSESGFGAFDWRARSTSAIDVPVMGLVRGVDWPVDGTLPTRLPGAADAISGWLVILVSQAELDEPITLLYQPLKGDQSEPVPEMVIHAP